MNSRELKIINVFDLILKQDSVRAALDSFLPQVERKLSVDNNAVMAWEPVPLEIYGNLLPKTIHSSWIFILRANRSTGAERHPNSHQRMVSYRGEGDLQIWSRGKWYSHLLESSPEFEIESRWVSIPPNIWHQAVVPRTDWVVVSFHTETESELIEERPDPLESKLIRKRKYSP